MVAAGGIGIIGFDFALRKKTGTGVPCPYESMANLQICMASFFVSC